MNESNRANIWKLTAIGVVVAAASALVTGLVVANRAPAPTQEAKAAAAEARALARKGPITLLCGCPDAKRCHRTLLQSHLLDSAE